MLKRYRLIVRLGTGGMAEVYLAVASGASGSNKLHVLKVLRRDVSMQEQAALLQMFEDEGRLAVRLNHPHIIQSHDVDFDDGYHFIAMEYLEGQPFDRIITRAQANPELFPLELRLFVLTQVLEALEYAHSLTDYDGTPLGIVHRDVSPQNVFVLYTGHTKLLDFGVAKTLDSNKTQAGVIKGKVAYMAPEQLAGTPVDARADVFSVGVMLWEAIAGRRMHDERSVLEIVKRVANGTLPELREAAPAVSALLERIVSRTLAFRPENRYPDVRSLRDDLLELPDLKGIAAREVGQKVEALFNTERRELNEKIREAMQSVNNRDSIPDSDSLLELGPSPELPGPLKPRPATIDPSTAASFSKSDSNAPTTVPLAPRPVAPATAVSPEAYQPRSLRFMRSGLARRASIGLGASAILVYLLTKASAPTTSSSVASAPGHDVANAPASQDLQLPMSSADAGEVVRVWSVAHPSEETTALDGKPMPMNPYNGVHTCEQGAYFMEAIAEGYVPRADELDFSHDVNQTVDLDSPAAPTASAEAPHPGTPPPPKSRGTAVPSRKLSVPPNPYPSSEAPKTGGSYTSNLQSPTRGK